MQAADICYVSIGWCMQELLCHTVITNSQSNCNKMWQETVTLEGPWYLPLLTCGDFFPLSICFNGMFLSRLNSCVATNTRRPRVQPGDTNDIQYLDSDAKESSSNNICCMMFVVSDPGQASVEWMCYQDGLYKGNKKVHWSTGWTIPHELGMQVQNQKCCGLKWTAGMSWHKTQMGSNNSSHSVLLILQKCGEKVLVNGPW